jgi:myo-inositol-1(or 4)-monophosphatase
MARPIDVAIEAAKAAGAVLRRGYGKPKAIRFKDVVDLVTDFDEESERTITRILAEAYPSSGILTEESGATLGSDDYRWIVDPLDGTTNFAHDFPHFAVSIALEDAGALVLGVVYNPVLDELFVAERGNVPTLNGQPIGVSTRRDISHALLATGTPYDRTRAVAQLDDHAQALLQAQALRITGSAALDMCYVAAGRLDGYFERGINLWDVAAGLVILAAAGGTVTNYAGAPYDSGEGAIVASNSHVHSAVLGLLKG